MRKKALLTIALIALVTAVAMAADMTAVTTSDSKVVILHEDGTWQYFERRSYDQETGYLLSGVPEFKNLQWSEAKLVKLGNWLAGGRTGLYTSGEFYLLELNADSAKASSSDKWNAPYLVLSDGTKVEGFSASLSQSRYSSTYKSLTGQSSVTVKYTMIFEIPSAAEVSSVKFIKDGSEAVESATLSELRVF